MRKLCLLALVAAAPMFAGDGNTASTSATASVNLYAPIVLTKVSDVNFGVYVFDGKAVTLQMAQDGTVSGGNKFSGQQLAHDLTTSKAGAFQWSKDANLNVDIKVNDQLLAATTNTLAAMKLGDDKVLWTIKADKDETNPSLGKLTLYGDLAIADGAATKSYTGTFTVNVAYN